MFGTPSSTIGGTTPGGFGGTGSTFGGTGTSSTFGGTGTSSTFGGTSGGFGTSTATTPSSTGFSFGASTGAAPSSSPFSFGGTTGTTGTSTAQTGAAPSAFSFPGATTTTTTAASPFSFGGTTAATTPSTGFGFGTSSTFGTGQAPATSSLFGASPVARPAVGTGGQWGTQATSTSLFGGAATSAVPAWSGGAKPAAVTPQQRLEAIAGAYSPNSPDCRFRHMLYNRVPENEVKQYTKPANVNDRLWNQAVEANPDPSRLVPVQANGFADLSLRIKEQDKTTEEHQRALEEIQKFIAGLQRKHDLDTTIKIEQFKRRHMQLAHRLIGVMKKIEVLRSKGYSLVVDEENFRTKLENLQRELNQPNHFKGRLNELASLVRMQQEDRAIEQFEAIDSESLDTIFNFLSGQKSGLNHLISILKKDMSATDALAEHLTREVKE